MFIGKRGRLQSQGVRRALERRADEAQVSGMNPHRFRHTCTHRLLEAGVHEGEVMRLMGMAVPLDARSVRGLGRR